MAKAMLGPSVVLVVHTAAEQSGTALFIRQKESVAFRGNCEAIELALLTSRRVEVVFLDLEYGTRNSSLVVRIECGKPLGYFPDFLPRYSGASRSPFRRS
jgi:hypothetical protein